MELDDSHNQTRDKYSWMEHYFVQDHERNLPKVSCIEGTRTCPKPSSPHYSPVTKESGHHRRESYPMSAQQPGVTECQTLKRKRQTIEDDRPSSHDPRGTNGNASRNIRLANEDGSLSRGKVHKHRKCKTDPESTAHRAVTEAATTPHGTGIKRITDPRRMYPPSLEPPINSINPASKRRRTSAEVDSSWAPQNSAEASPTTDATQNDSSLVTDPMFKDPVFKDSTSQDSMFRRSGNTNSQRLKKIHKTHSPVENDRYQASKTPRAKTLRQEQGLSPPSDPEVGSPKTYFYFPQDANSQYNGFVSPPTTPLQSTVSFDRNSLTSEAKDNSSEVLASGKDA